MSKVTIAYVANHRQWLTSSIIYEKDVSYCGTEEDAAITFLICEDY
jgi:hypothetical protein